MIDINSIEIQLALLIHVEAPPCKRISLFIKGNTL